MKFTVSMNAGYIQISVTGGRRAAPLKLCWICPTPSGDSYRLDWRRSPLFPLDCWAPPDDLPAILAMCLRDPRVDRELNEYV